jgi:hypothetical protein
MNPFPTFLDACKLFLLFLCPCQCLKEWIPFHDENLGDDAAPDASKTTPFVPMPEEDPAANEKLEIYNIYGKNSRFQYDL